MVELFKEGNIFGTDVENVTHFVVWTRKWVINNKDKTVCSVYCK